MASDFQYSCFQCVFFTEALIHRNWRFCVGVGVYKWTSSFFSANPMISSERMDSKTS